MYTTQLQNLSQTYARSVGESTTVNDNELETVIGASLLGDLNEQLATIAQSMQDQMYQKQELREDISYLNSIGGQETVTSPSGSDAYEITEDEKKKLEEMGLTDLDITAKSDGTGYYLSESSLQAAADNKQEALSGLNSNSELTMIQVQNLVDQRKTLVTMLSNLMASHNETLMAIVRNMKL